MLMVAEGTFVWDFHGQLTDHAKFKETTGRTGQDRWGAFLNKLDNYILHVLLLNLEILRNEIGFALNNIDIHDEQSFVFLKRFSNALFSTKDTTLDYDEIKPFAGFLWRAFSGWDPVSGYSERDHFSDAITAI
jgi:hypothetical protein